MKRRLYLFACMALAVAAGPLRAEVVVPPDESASAEEAKRYFTEDPDAPIIAPKGYDVTIVEYMDYQCPSCRTSHEPLQQLLAKDKKVRVIFRDWPIFGDASVHAALIALAAKFQGKYVEVHSALLETPQPLTKEKVESAARKAGVDWAQLKKDMVDHSREIEDLLMRNDHQANLLGLDGTPGFIIGNVQSFGGMNLEQFEASVKRAREDAAKGAAAKATR